MRRPTTTALRLALGALAGSALALTGGTVAQGVAVGGATSSTTSPAVSQAAADTAREQAAVSSYWTPERMRSAIPADRIIAGKTASTAAVAKGSPTVVSAAAAKPKPVPMAAVSATTGKVFFTLGGANYVCSGSAVASQNRDTVLTAGHCVNEGPGAFATNWSFVPAYDNGSRPYGTWTARTLVTTSAWANSGDINYDVGFAVMNTLGGQHLTDAVGSQPIAFNQARGQYMTSYGYPAAAPFDGQTLQSCAGTVHDDPTGQTNDQGMPCNMTGGSSGGPWFLGGSLNSVNSFKYNNDNNTMYGPYFGSTIQSTYSSAQTR